MKLTAQYGEIYRSAGGERAGDGLASSALRTHVSYIVGLTATAVVRSATIEDKVSVARLVAREGYQGAAMDRRRRQDRIRKTLSALNDRRAVIHVVELNQRLCGLVVLKVASRGRIFASEVVLTEKGRSFDPALALRLTEHAVRCCRPDQWKFRHYLADLPSPTKAARHFRRLGYVGVAQEAWIGLSDWLLHGRRSHALCFEFGDKKRGSDEFDPRIVWF